MLCAVWGCTDMARALLDAGASPLTTRPVRVYVAMVMSQWSFDSLLAGAAPHPLPTANIF